MHYAIRLTFGLVHASLLSLFSITLAFLVPSFSHFLFSLYGCVLAPGLSLLLAAFCSACVGYVSHEGSFPPVKRIVAASWLPPIGVFLTSLLILPLEMMPSLGFHGPISTLVMTSIIANFFIVLLLQIHSAKSIQDSPALEDPESESSVSSPPPFKGSSGPT